MAGKLKALVFGGQTPKYHRFIHVGPLFQQVLGWHGIEVDLTENPDDLRWSNLSRYPVWVNYSTRREIDQETAEGILRHVQEGGGHVVLHGSTATFESTPNYLELVGAHFTYHDRPTEIEVSVADPDHPILKGFPPQFRIVDEPYLFDRLTDYHLILEGRTQERELHVAWTKDIGKGRLFYLALGHDFEQWRHPYLQYLLVRGVQWAARAEKTF